MRKGHLERESRAEVAYFVLVPRRMQRRDPRVSDPEIEGGIARAMTREEWAASKSISIATYHNLKKRGLAPEELEVPGTNLIRITAKADREWEARMRELAATDEHKRERERRSATARIAGRLAAQSPRHVSRRKRAATTAAARAKRRAAKAAAPSVTE
jgi:hypothetical protein